MFEEDWESLSKATQHLNILVKYGVPTAVHSPYSNVYRYLAIIHGQNYVTLSLVALAVHKIYPHRKTIVKAETERSLQYGSDAGPVKYGSVASARTHKIDGLTWTRGGQIFSHWTSYCNCRR